MNYGGNLEEVNSIEQWNLAIWGNIYVFSSKALVFIVGVSPDEVSPCQLLSSLVS